MKRAYFVFLASTCAIGSVAAACASSSSGGTRAVLTDSGPDSTSDSMTPSGPVAAGTEACEAQIRFDQRCADNDAGTSSACADARRKDCGKFGTVLSDVYRNAIVACETEAAMCGDANGCIDGKLAAAVPTQAQTKVRDAYCTTCGAEAGATCAADFFRITADGVGAGYLILQVSDSVLLDLRAKCTGTALDLTQPGVTCRDAFTGCAGNTAQNAAPVLPDVCQPPPMPQPDMDADIPDTAPAMDAAVARDAGAG